MQQGPGGVRGEEEGGRGRGEGRLGFWQVAARQRGRVCVEISGNCARRSTMELCVWALEFLVILVINN